MGAKRRHTDFCFGLLFLAVACFGDGTAGHGEGRLVFGPRQYEYDERGAVLCAWSFYIYEQISTNKCDFARRPADNALDESIRAMDEFILANSSLHPTRAMLDDYKRREIGPAVNAEIEAFGGLPAFCAHWNSVRKTTTADEIRAVLKILEVPREPVMMPCLP